VALCEATARIAYCHSNARSTQVAQTALDEDAGNEAGIRPSDRA
jgi:hypothetical protein